MPIRLAIVDDYEVVVRGLADMLRDHSDEIEVVQLTSRLPVDVEVDIALYDTFAQVQGDGQEVSDLLANPRVAKVVVYSWNIEESLVRGALERGASAYLSKTISATELVKALQRVHAGLPVPFELREDEPADAPESGSWPGRAHGLTAREAEVIALITQGLSNQEIATMAALSINSVKSYIRTSYRKMGVSSRTNAVLWGLDHGFNPDRARVRTPAG